MVRSPEYGKWYHVYRSDGISGHDITLLIYRGKIARIKAKKAPLIIGDQKRLPAFFSFPSRKKHKNVSYWNGRRVCHGTPK